MAPGDVLGIIILSYESVITVEHDACKSVLPLILSACCNKDYEREFKALALVNGHGSDLVLVGICYFDISLLDMDLHLFKFISYT